MNKITRLVLILVFVLALIASTALLQAAMQNRAVMFSGERAFQDVQRQVDFGPRTPGSDAHAKTVDWIMSELRAAGWTTEVQEAAHNGLPVRNILARRGGNGPIVLLGAHYDTRLQSSQEIRPDLRAKPVPGANDGASGVAVLLELARTLPDTLNDQVWLVFFDAEDQGDLPGWESWSVGADLFVQSMVEKPSVAVIIDMIGDTDLNLYFERNSDMDTMHVIWAIAAQSGYGDQFIPEARHSILDDHIPFIKAGIPAVDIIDFDYPYWHTQQDTLDKVSPDSLEVVGLTLTHWLISR